jgi:hypothetical protein
VLQAEREKQEAIKPRKRGIECFELSQQIEAEEKKVRQQFALTRKGKHEKELGDDRKKDRTTSIAGTHIQRWCGWIAPLAGHPPLED